MIVFIQIKMCNSIKNLIHKSKKEPINLKELSAIQESRRKMSTTDSVTTKELHKTSLKLDRVSTGSIGESGIAAAAATGAGTGNGGSSSSNAGGIGGGDISKQETNSIQSTATIVEEERASVGAESTDETSSLRINIPVIDENEDSSSTYSLSEKI